MEVGNPEADSVNSILGKTRAQLHLEVERRKEMNLEMNNLRNKLKTMEGEKEDGRRPRELARKIKLLEEQVQYLEGRLDTCRQEGAFKLSSIEGLLGNENGKLKAREKDLRRKLQRERETNKQQTVKVSDLTIELRKIQEESKKHEVHHAGWMKYVRLPDQGEWPAIKLDTQQNKKALRHIFEQVEKEGGPPVNLDPSLFLHCVILFLWWKREATVKMLEENEAISGKSSKNFEIEELRGLNTALQQRIRALEDALGDCRVERQTFETTVSTNLNQLLKDKYDLSNKVARLEDTVSALHLDNNLLRAEVNDKSASQQAKMNLDELTAELKSRLQTSESELREIRLLKEQMEIDMRQASKRLQTLEQDARIQETVSKEHRERMASGDARRAELETMTSEFQAQIWSLQHDLQTLEESRNILRKERDSFLGQLTKALDQSDESREKIREQDYQIRQLINDQTHKTEALKRNDEVIGNLRRDLANHREGQAKLIEEKEKRRSLEVISTNHERLVREMEERMRNEEVDSATLLAELCGAQTEERERLEEKIETLEMEKEEMVDVIETLSNDKAALRADTQRLKLELERVSEKFHNVIKRQALRVLHPPDQAARMPRVYTDAWTATDPVRKRDSPVGEDERDGSGDRRTRELEELIDLLVTVKGSAFSRLILGGMEGGASGFQDVQDGDVEGFEDPEETRMNIVENSNKGEEGTFNEQLRSVPGEIRQVQRDIVTKLRALALMMKARQKLRGQGHLGRGLREVKGHDDTDEKSHENSDHDYPELVNEPLITKEERSLLYSPNKPNVRDSAAVKENLRLTNVPSPEVVDRAKETSEQQQSQSPEAIDSRRGKQEQGSDQSTSESENEDLLSTLERERERLKKELAEIKDTEARVQEHLVQEEEAHRLYLKTVSEYEEECVRMQQEKEELLREPSVDDNLAEASIDGRLSTLDLELEKMLLEELESLKAENELLMSDRFEQQMVFESREEGRQDIPLTPSKPREELPRKRKETGDYILGLEDQAQSETASLEPDTEAQVSKSQLGAVAKQPEEHFKRVHPASLQYVNDNSVVARYQSPRPEDRMPYQQNRSLRQQPHIEGFINPSQKDKPFNELSTALQQTQAQQAECRNLQDSRADQFVAEDKASGHQEPGVHSMRSEVSLSSDYIPLNLLSEFERPVQKTLVSRQEVPIRSALDALEQTRRQLKHQRSQDGEVNHSIKDNGQIMSSIGESGDKPEADQRQEHFSSESRHQGERRPNQGNFSRQNAVSGHIHEQERNTLRSPYLKGSDTEGRRLRSRQPQNSSSREPNARSKRHLQKQRTVGESNQPSSFPTSDCNSIHLGIQRNTRDSCQVFDPEAVEGKDNSAQMFTDDGDHREQSDYQDDLKRSPNDRDDIGKSRKRVVHEVGVTPDRESGGFENFRSREKAGVLGKASMGSQSINALSSQQDNKQVVMTKPTQSSRMVSGDSNTKGVNDKKQILRGRRIPDKQREEAVAFSDQDQQYANPLRKQQGIQNLPKNMQDDKTLSKDSQSCTQQVEKELSESRAALLELYKDRQTSQDQLTAALQTEVKLQKLVDSLRSKVDCLQVSMNKSAELVTSLEADKEYLRSNHTAAQEERRRIQEHLTRVNKINKELEEKLKSSSKQGELLKKKHDTMKKRYASETDKNVELKTQVIKLQKAAEESESPIVKNDRSGDRSSPEAYKLVRNINRDQVQGKLQNGPISESGENKELRYQLTDVKQSESSLRVEVERLHRQAETAQSCMPDGNEFPTRVQQEGGSSLAAAKVKEAINQRDLQRLETQLEAAKRQIQDLSDTTRLLEIENERLQTRRMAEAEKRLELQKEIAELRSGTPRLQNKPLTETASLEYSKEGRKSRLNDTHLKMQLGEQIDRIVDLENELDDSQALIKDLERERNILQDDFTNALQKQSLLKTQTRKVEDRCKFFTSKLEDSQAQVQSLKDEMEGYLEQDFKVRDEEVRLMKRKLRELRVVCQQSTGELAEAKLRAENLEAICKMHSDKQKKDEIHKIKLEADLHELKVENQEKTRQLLQLGKMDSDFDEEAETDEALTVIDRKDSDLRFLKKRATSVRSGMGPTASIQNMSVASKQLLEAKKDRGYMICDVNEGELYGSTSRREEQEYITKDLDYQIHDFKEATEANFKGLESARADIVECSNRLQELEQKCGTSVRDLQEELETQTNNITRLRESTEARLQEAVSMTKRLTQESQQAIASVVEKDLALRLKDTQVSAGQRLVEMRKLLERSIIEQRKQVASVAQLQQTQEKALLQHSALKIRLRQQMEKTSGALSSWERERQSLKRQLGEAYKTLKLIETQVGSAVNLSQNLPGLEAVQDRLMSQQEGHMRGLVRMIQNCPCQREVGQKNEGFTISTQTIRDKQKTQQKTDAMQLKKANRQISFDLQLASESLELNKKECWRLQESLQDACLRETELTSAIRQLQAQVKLEVEMQAKLAKRSEDQEAEIFRLRSALGRQSFKEDTSTSLSQEPSAKPQKLNEMLTDFSREIQGHLESHMEKTQLQNETDDRKKIQELEWQLSNMDAQRSVDKITVQSLTDDNRRLRTMVYKLRERIADNQMSHFKDSRMDGVYQALARAQVRVVATSMADGTQTVLTGADVYGNTATTSLGASRLVDRRHMGSAGNSLGDSYD